MDLTISDYIYTSPGDYFDTSHNLNLALTYDDSDLLGGFALNPHFYFLQELDSHSGLGTKGDTLSQYYEIGIAPGHTFEGESDLSGDGELSRPPSVLAPMAITARVSDNLTLAQPSVCPWPSSRAPMEPGPVRSPANTGAWGLTPARLTDNPNNPRPGAVIKLSLPGPSGRSSRECSAIYRARSFSSSSIGVCFRRTEEEDDEDDSPTHKVRTPPRQYRRVTHDRNLSRAPKFLAGIGKGLCARHPFAALSSTVIPKLAQHAEGSRP